MAPPTDTALPPLAALHAPGALAVQRLRNVLRLNGTTSLLGGLLAAAAPGVVDDLLGTGHPGWVRLVGLGLSAYAVDLLVLAGGRARHLRRWTPAVVGADAAWVAATIGAIAAGWFSGVGALAMGLVATAVGTFAGRQRHHHRAMGPVVEPDASPPLELAWARTSVPVASPTMWTVITDHELYGRLAPNLAGVRATAPDGAGLERTCTSRGGRAWHEACTLWEEGERFEVEVDTADYPYPLQLVRGGWWLRPDGDGHTTVGMQFAFRPDATLRGRAFAIAMQAAFPLVLRRILRGWAKAAAELDGRR